MRLFLVMAEQGSQEELYRAAVAACGGALARLARSYEFDVERRRDLEQEIHVALWRSMAVYDGRCAMRTWVYRVAHNTAVSYVMRNRRNKGMVSLEELEVASGGDEPAAADRRMAMERLMRLVERLKPLDRQTVLLYLEGMEAAEIGEVTGDSPGNVAVRIHRIKRILASQFAQGGGR